MFFVIFEHRVHVFADDELGAPAPIVVSDRVSVKASNIEISKKFGAWRNIHCRFCHVSALHYVVYAALALLADTLKKSTSSVLSYRHHYSK